MYLGDLLFSGGRRGGINLGVIGVCVWGMARRCGGRGSLGTDIFYERRINKNYKQIFNCFSGLPLLSFPDLSFIMHVLLALALHPQNTTSNSEHAFSVFPSLQPIVHFCM